MKVKYDAEADILMIVLSDEFPANAISEPGGVIVSYNETNQPISVEFLNAAKRKLFNPEIPHNSATLQVELLRVRK